MSLTPPYVILLNGVGSAGKSSIARALQGRVQTPLLHVQMDVFLDMLPAALQEHPSTFTYAQIVRDGFYEVEIAEGAVGKQLLQGMRCAVKAMAETGCSLVVDDVLIGASDPGFDDYRRLLVPFSFRTVGVFASLETLERREKERGDRLQGLARWQYTRVHNDISYDLVVNSDNFSPPEIADQIIQAFGLQSSTFG